MIAFFFLPENSYLYWLPFQVKTESPATKPGTLNPVTPRKKKQLVKLLYRGIFFLSLYLSLTLFVSVLPVRFMCPAMHFSLNTQNYKQKKIENLNTVQKYSKSKWVQVAHKSQETKTYWSPIEKQTWGFKAISKQ